MRLRSLRVMLFARTKPLLPRCFSTLSVFCFLASSFVVVVVVVVTLVVVMDLLVDVVVALVAVGGGGGGGRGAGGGGSGGVGFVVVDAFLQCFDVQENDLIPSRCYANCGAHSMIGHIIDFDGRQLTMWPSFSRASPENPKAGGT